MQFRHFFAGRILGFTGILSSEITSVKMNSSSSLVGKIEREHLTPKWVVTPFKVFTEMFSLSPDTFNTLINLVSQKVWVES